MSILIKGYEMPESCRECPLEMYYMICGETRCRATNRLLASDFKTIDFEGRADDCPLTDVPDTNVGDTINRQAAIRWVKTECNPYGKPTLDFESGKRVMKHLEQMPPAPERTHWIPVTERLPEVEIEPYYDDGYETLYSSKPVFICAKSSYSGNIEYGMAELLGEKDFEWGGMLWPSEEIPESKNVIAWMPIPEPYKEVDG